MRMLICAAMGVVLIGSTQAYAGDPPLATEIVASGLNAVTYVTSAPGDTSRLYAIQQNGEIRVIENGVVLPRLFLDIDSLVPNETFNGLLGIAFHPDYDNNRYVYLQHPRGGASSDRITIARYTAAEDGYHLIPSSRDEILVLPYPAFPGHHVGGWIGFGPDGYLYIPLGDGHTTGGESAGGARAQSLSSPWGKVLRIDVDGDDFPADPDRDYAIPPDNPFVGQGGDEAVWLLGMRNPYRANFDALTGDFWIADVGLFAREEIDFHPAASPGGENYGWNCAEGTLCTSNANCNCETDDLTDPIFEYTHSLGCSISGGAIYRGCAIPGLEGTYFYGDWCSSRIWSLRYEGGVVVDAQERTAELDPPGGVTFGPILSISEGPYGELYISDGSRIYRIIPAGGVVDDNSNGIPDSCELCESNPECDDGDACNGTETCVDSACQPGTPLTCVDNDVCNGTETCDSVMGCQDGTPLTCDNGMFCDGAETCDAGLGCQDGPDPCQDPKLPICDEENDQCVAEGCPCDDCDINGDGSCNILDLARVAVCEGEPVVPPCDTSDVNCDGVIDILDGIAAGCLIFENGGPECCELCTDQPDPDAFCNDGLFCNGTEFCNIDLSICTDGLAVNCDDGVGCTVDSCVEATDSCDNAPDDAACDNAIFCDGVETCDAGLGCQDGPDPCKDPKLPLCDEEGGTCEPDVAACVTNLDCQDTDPCVRAICDTGSGTCANHPRFYGDLNHDGVKNIVDLVCEARVAFQGLTVCSGFQIDEAEVDYGPNDAGCGDGLINIVDVIITARIAFQNLDDDCCGFTSDQSCAEVTGGAPHCPK